MNEPELSVPPKSIIAFKTARHAVDESVNELHSHSIFLPHIYRSLFGVLGLHYVMPSRIFLLNTLFQARPHVFDGVQVGALRRLI